MALIICPECKREISDKAVSCPHCGYPLQESLKDNNTSGGNNITDEGNTKKDNTPQPKPRTSTTVAIVSLLILALAGMAIWWVFFRASNNSDEREIYDKIVRFEQENALDSLDAALTEYLDRYNPDALYYTEMKNLHDRLSTESEDWKNAFSESTTSAIHSFLDKHPDGFYREPANNALDSLSFIEAQHENTKQAYERYINIFPDGKHVEEAEAKINELEHPALTDKELEDANASIKGHFQALANKNEEKLKATIAYTMSSYLGKSQPSIDDIITYMERIHQSGRKLDFDVDDIQITKVNSGEWPIYNVQFSLKESIYNTNEIDFYDEDEESEPSEIKRYKGTAIMNKYMRITSLVLK